MKFQIAGQQPENVVTFSTEIDGDGDLTINANRGGVKAQLGYIGSRDGKLRLYPVAGPDRSRIGLAFDDTGRLQVA